MKGTIDRPSDVAEANDVTASASAPLELLSKTSEELAGQIGARERLAQKSDELATARDELKAVEKSITDGTLDVRRTGRHMLIGPSEDEEYNVKLDRRRRIEVRCQKLEGEVRTLAGEIRGEHELDSLQAALAVAEEREAKSSAELGGRILQLEDARARIRVELEAKRGLLRKAREALDNADDRRVRAGADTSKDVLALEEQIQTLEREIRQLTTAHEREIQESEPELAILRPALAVAQRRAAVAHYDAAIADSKRVIEAAESRKKVALAAVREIEDEIGKLSRAHGDLAREARAATQIGYS